jgi:hypothetical protein
MFKSVLTALLLTAPLVLPPARAEAQVRGAAMTMRASNHGSFTAASISNAEVHNSLRGRSGTRRLYPPFLLGDPYYYADDTSQPPATDQGPQVVFVQMPAAPEAAKPTAPEPLLIEWQNDRYVRIGDAKPEDKPATKAGDVAAPPAKPMQIANHAPPPTPQLQPVVLIYRDGHREQISNYTIVDGVLYASGDYWTDGYWNKKIQLASLNLPATAQASQAQGAQFVLPNSPNEVIIRP